MGPAPAAGSYRLLLSAYCLLVYLGGTANPEGGRQRTDKAEARRAANAQASFPSRRAREKAVSERVTGIVVSAGAALLSDLGEC